jgi:hypothetical protein
MECDGGGEGHFCIGHRHTSSTPSHSRTPARTRTHSRFRRLPFPSLRSRVLSQAGRLAAILHRGYVNAFVDCLRAGWCLSDLLGAKPSQATHRIGSPESDPSLSSGDQ